MKKMSLQASDKEDKSYSFEDMPMHVLDEKNISEEKLLEKIKQFYSDNVGYSFSVIKTDHNGVERPIDLTFDCACSLDFKLAAWRSLLNGTIEDLYQNIDVNGYLPTSDRFAGVVVRVVNTEMF